MYIKEVISDALGMSLGDLLSTTLDARCNSGEELI
jgi:hypothetical protein